MKRLVILLVASWLSIITHAQQLTLVNKSKSKYTIVIPAKPTVIEVQAAMVLQDYLQRMSGARLPIEQDNTKPRSNEILIGNVNRPELEKVPLEKLGKDGLFIQ